MEVEKGELKAATSGKCGRQPERVGRDRLLPGRRLWRRVAKVTLTEGSGYGLWDWRELGSSRTAKCSSRGEGCARQQSLPLPGGLGAMAELGSSHGVGGRGRGKNCGGGGGG